MSKSEKQIAKENERRKKILDTAFQIFVEKKIEGVSMGEIAEAVGIEPHYFDIMRIRQSL